MLEPVYAHVFKKEYTLAMRRGMNMGTLKQVMDILVNEQPLPPERKDHPLRGNYNNYRECHIQGDWVLVYRVYPKKRQIGFARTGTHADLFKK